MSRSMGEYEKNIRDEFGSPTYRRYPGTVFKFDKETRKTCVWNFFHPPLLIDRVQRERGQPWRIRERRRRNEERGEDSAKKEEKKKSYLVKPKVGEQWDYICKKKWTDYSGVKRADKANLSRRNLFEEVFSPTLVLQSNEEENVEVFSGLHSLAHMKLEDVEELEKKSDLIRKRMEENKIQGLKELEEILNQQMEKYTNSVHAKIVERKKVLTKTSNLEEKMKMSDVILSPNPTPLTNLIMKCSDVLFVILEYLSTQELLLKVSLSCSYFFKYVKKYVPIEAALSPTKFELLPFEKILSHYKIGKLEYGDVSRGYFDFPFEDVKIESLCRILETHKNEIRGLKVAQLHEVVFTSPSRRNKDLVEDFDDHGWGRRSADIPPGFEYAYSSSKRRLVKEDYEYTMKRRQMFYDKINSLTRLTSLGTFILPSQMDNLQFLKRLCFPINFTVLSHIVKKRKKKKKTVVPRVRTPGAPEEEEEEKQRPEPMVKEKSKSEPEEIKLETIDRLIDYLESPNSDNLEVVAFALGRVAHQFRYGSRTQTIAKEVYSYYEKLLNSVQKGCKKLKRFYGPYFSGFRCYSESFLKFLSSRTFEIDLDFKRANDMDDDDDMFDDMGHHIVGNNEGGSGGKIGDFFAQRSKVEYFAEMMEKNQVMKKSKKFGKRAVVKTAMINVVNIFRDRYFDGGVGYAPLSFRTLRKEIHFFRLLCHNVPKLRIAFSINDEYVITRMAGAPLPPPPDEMMGRIDTEEEEEEEEEEEVEGEEKEGSEKEKKKKKEKKEDTKKKDPEDPGSYPPGTLFDTNFLRVFRFLFGKKDGILDAHEMDEEPNETNTEGLGFAKSMKLEEEEVMRMRLVKVRELCFRMTFGFGDYYVQRRFRDRFLESMRTLVASPFLKCLAFSLSYRKRFGSRDRLSEIQKSQALCERKKEFLGIAKLVMEEVFEMEKNHVETLKIDVISGFSHPLHVDHVKNFLLKVLFPFVKKYPKEGKNLKNFVATMQITDLVFDREEIVDDDDFDDFGPWGRRGSDPKKEEEKKRFVEWLLEEMKVLVKDLMKEREQGRGWRRFSLGVNLPKAFQSIRPPWVLKVDRKSDMFFEWKIEDDPRLFSGGKNVSLK